MGNNTIVSTNSPGMEAMAIFLRTNPYKPNVNAKDKDIKGILRKIMWENAAIVRNKKDLQMAVQLIETFLKEEVGRLLFLRLLTAKSILKFSIERERSLGAHYIKEN